MHISNRYYGHDYILAWYCGSRNSRPIRGVVQHGWCSGDPFPGLRQWGYARARRFVWNDENAAAIRAHASCPVSIIGAPLVYLVHQLKTAGRLPRAAPRDLTVVYPQHGLRTAPAIGEHESMAKVVVERDDPETTVVMLHVNEYRSSEVRNCYERHGLAVSCNWRIGTDSLAHDPLLLVRQVSLLQRARRVVSSQVATAVWYGAFLGAEPAIYGPVFRDSSLSDAETYLSQQQHRYPYLFEDCSDFDPEAGRQQSMTELGSMHQIEPVLLAAELGYTSSLHSVTARAAAVVQRSYLRAVRQLHA